MNHERIELTDNFMSAAVKLAEGNPGAITVLMKLAEEMPKVDPDAAFGPFAGLFSLDTAGIYGPRIWMFYKDLCKRNIVHMIGLQRAVQLGFMSESTLQSAISNPGLLPPAEIDNLVGLVKEQLPAFAA